MQKGEITIELKNDKRYNQLIFSDTGPGIPINFLPKLFGQFESREKMGHGTGLGLSFCKLVMQAYGGNITVISKEARTSFILNFTKIKS